MMRWSWVTDLVVPVAQAFAEATWLYAYFLVLAPPQSDLPGFVACAGLLVLASVAGRISARLPSYRLVNQTILVVMSLAVLLGWVLTARLPGDGSGLHEWLTGILHDPAGMLVIGMLGIALWGRGLWLGVIPIGTDTLARRFILGAVALVALCGLLALSKGMGVERYTDKLELLALVFFVVSPTAIALVNVLTVSNETSGVGSLSTVWIVALILPMLIVASVALVLSNQVAFVFTYGLHAFGKAILLVWSLLVWVWLWIVFVAEWVIGPWWPGTHKRGAADSLSVVQPPWRRQGITGTASELPLYVPAAVALTLVALLFVCLAVRRTRPHRRDNVDEERSWLFSWALLRQQLRSILLNLLGRYNRRRGAATVELADARRPSTSEPVPEDIRHLYRRFLRWAPTQGHRLLFAMTPSELENELLTSVPEVAEPVRLITGTYEDARYGNVDINGRRLAAAREAVNLLEARI